jgi:pyruvate/2-oxoglutarate dehydrogenase complex dihydrolipoamide dehydrogenase (E3) component
MRGVYRLFRIRCIITLSAIDDAKPPLPQHWRARQEATQALRPPPPPQTYDLVLQAVGRTPNGKKIAADKAGVAVTDRGFINVDIQMRTNVPHIFAIGDIVGQPMLAHKAVHEAHVAAEVIAGEQQGNKELAAAAFNARVIPSVAYTDPEVAWVGLTEDQAKAQGKKWSRKFEQRYKWKLRA